MQKEQLDHITNTITESAKELIGEKLHSVILYGSYARGDYKEDSDIDIMILVDIADEEIWRYRNKLNVVANDLDLEFDTFVSPHFQSIHVFYKWAETLPYYKNVIKDGVTLYAA